MITRNPIDLTPAQSPAINKTTDPYDKTRRAIDVATAKTTFEKTGDVKPFLADTSKVAEKVLGGTVEQYSLKQTQSGVQDADYANKVSAAQDAYKANPNEATAQALKDVMNTGFQRYSPESSKGITINSALRSIDVSEFDRKLYDVEADWKNDPEQFKDAYKKTLQEQINFYGAGSTKAVSLEQKMRSADEESLLHSVRNDQLAYEKDPVGTYDKLVGDRQKLIDFYGSNSDGYYASETLNKLNTTEQERLDTQASNDFEAGRVSYDGYDSYLKASMSKFEEGSTDYMKYYKASNQLEFNKQLDDLVRLQYSEAPGEVLKSMQAAQTEYAAGSTTYQTMQNSIDKMTTIIRQNAYNEMVKKEVQSRNEQIASLNSKVYLLQRDLESGDLSESSFKKKYTSYTSKLSYLKDSNTLPQFEIWNTYGTS